MYEKLSRTSVPFANNFMTHFPLKVLLMTPSRWLLEPLVIWSVNSESGCCLRSFPSWRKAWTPIRMTSDKEFASDWVKSWHQLVANMYVSSYMSLYLIVSLTIVTDIIPLHLQIFHDCVCSTVNIYNPIWFKMTRISISDLTQPCTILDIFAFNRVVG